MSLPAVLGSGFEGAERSPTSPLRHRQEKSFQALFWHRCPHFCEHPCVCMCLLKSLHQLASNNPLLTVMRPHFVFSVNKWDPKLTNICRVSVNTMLLPPPCPFQNKNQFAICCLDSFWNVYSNVFFLDSDFHVLWCIFINRSNGFYKSDWIQSNLTISWDPSVCQALRVETESVNTGLGPSR